MESDASTRSDAVEATAAKGAAALELVEAHAQTRKAFATAGLGCKDLGAPAGAGSTAAKRARGEEGGGCEDSSGSSSCTCDVAGAMDDAASSKPPPSASAGESFAFRSKLQRFTSSEPLQHTSSEVTTETCVRVHAATPPSSRGLGVCIDVTMMTPPPRKRPCAAGYTDGVVLECPGAPVKQRRQMRHASSSRIASLMRPLNFSVCT